jgi:hypothetical protein
MMNNIEAGFDNDNVDEFHDTCENYVDEDDPFPNIDSDEE